MCDKKYYFCTKYSFILIYCFILDHLFISYQEFFMKMILFLINIINFNIYLSESVSVYIYIKKINRTCFNISANMTSTKRPVKILWFINEVLNRH